MSPSPLFLRSGEEWYLGWKDSHTFLKASVGGEPNQPPTNGWQFDTSDLGSDPKDWEEDASLTCTPPVNSPPCCLKVSLTGPAKEVVGKCEGEYKSTGLVSRGREVTAIC